MNMLLLAQETLNAGETPATSQLQGWLVFLGVLALIIVPFVLGNVIAKALRYKDAATRIGVVLFALTLGLAPFVTRLISGESVLDAIDLGIDLAGGTNMTFQVDHKAAEREGKEVTTEVMNKMVDAINRRVNPTGTEEVTVRKVGRDRLEVIVPGADQERREKTRREVNNLGELEFSLLANEVDHATIIQKATQLGPETNNVYENGNLIAMWRRSAITEDGEPKIFPGQRVHTRQKEVNGKQVTEYLCVVDPDPSRRITGRLLKSVRETVTDKGLAVGFTFNERGGHLFQQLTSRYQPKAGAGYSSRLAVLLNGEIHSAPTINAVIGATGVIEGGFTQEQIDELVGVLNAGALEVPLLESPVSEFTISPTLGIDVQRKGFTAIIIALVAVLAVTIGYYLKAGFVADVCLAINLILVMGVMSLIDATFTLPGLAGIVLTIGMAVDANVLIFERMREEKNKGSSVRMSIKNGFEKAFSTIVDANVTTLLTAIVLYYIGTDQVKGFAVTLFIGIVMSMFSALYVGRLIFDIAEHKKWIKEIKMMSLINPENINFLNKKSLAAVASIVLIVVGLGAVAMRGAENLDIDFRGGSMVTFEFDGDTPTVEEVRTALATKFADNSLEQLAVDEDGQSKTMFRMRTTESDAHKVSDEIKTAFAATPYKLIQQHLEIGEVQEIAAVAEESQEGVSGDEPDQFAGGHSVIIKATEKMSPTALAEEAAESLKGVANKYLDAEELVRGAAAGEVAPKVNDIKLEFAKNVAAADLATMLPELKTRLESDPHFAEVNTFDTQVAGEAKQAAITAMVFSLIAIIAYLWVRFQRVTFGLAACAALVHDVLCVLGVLALAGLLGLDYKINLPIVAAFLTIVGYSLNDTIVVFDRIREVRGRNPALTENMVNVSLNQTLSRTLLTSLTTLVVVLILWLIGGEGIEGFAFCLIMGVVVGTYSSIYVASPALVWLMNRERRTTAIAK